jgi:hypothetical protein
MHKSVAHRAQKVATGHPEIRARRGFSLTWYLRYVRFLPLSAFNFYSLLQVDQLIPATG